jgi:uncharacterized membrane protein YagU involved in acid resistance
MALVMYVLHRRLVPRRRATIPPREITSNVLDTAGVGQRLPDEAHDAATTVAHFGYGAATGTVFGALRPDFERNPLRDGVLWGIAVWAVSYLGWLPATGLFGPPREQPRNREAVMVAAHLLWGAGLGFAGREIRALLEHRSNPSARRATARDTP